MHPTQALSGLDDTVEDGLRYLLGEVRGQPLLHALHYGLGVRHHLAINMSAPKPLGPTMP